MDSCWPEPLCGIPTGYFKSRTANADCSTCAIPRLPQGAAAWRCPAGAAGGMGRYHGDMSSATHPASRLALAMDLDRVEALSADLERIAEESDAAGAGGAMQLMRNLVALFKARVPHYHWVGIYLLEADELWLGPYAGKPTPHVRIPLGQGICGAAAEAGRSLLVSDVHADARYLACSLETRSELVVPILDGATVLGEIDIDSDQPQAFNEHDQALLERAASLIAGAISRAPAPPRWQQPEALHV